MASQRELQDSHRSISQSSAGSGVLDDSLLDGVHGILPKHHPLLGTFTHAPRAGNVGSRYFDSEITTRAEHERQKRLRHNVWTGQFHSAPSHYTPLHNLSRFRARTEPPKPVFLSKKEPPPRVERQSVEEPARPCASAPTSPRARASSASRWGNDLAAPQQPLAMLQRSASDEEFLQLISRSSRVPDATRTPLHSGPSSGSNNGYRRRVRSDYVLRRKAKQGSRLSRHPASLPLSVTAIVSTPVKKLSGAARSKGALRSHSHAKEASLSPSIVQASAATPLRGGAERRAEGGGGRGRRMAKHGRSNSSGVESEDQNPWAVNTAASICEKYELLEGATHELGRGMFSVVRTALHKGTGRHYAIKMVRKRYLVNREEKEMIQREREIHQVQVRGGPHSSTFSRSERCFL